MGRKRHAAHGHHGGAWKVAYADFVTSMMALFLVLWLIGLVPQEKREDLARYFKDPNVFQGNGMLSGKERPIDNPIVINPNMQMTAPVSPMQDSASQDSVMEKMKEAVEQGNLWSYRDKIKLTQTPEGVEVSIIEKANDVLFDSGSAQPRPKTLEILKEIAKELKGYGNHVAIGGHTDGRQLAGKNGYTNWELSADRANKARAILEADGLDPRRMAAVRGFADTRPINPKDPYASENRRISLVILKN